MERSHSRGGAIAVGFAFALAGILAAVAPSTTEAASPSKQALNRSSDSPPKIQGFKMRSARRGVLVRFAVAYPRIGDNPERTLVMLRVWKSKTRRKLYVERRNRARIPRGRTVHYEFLVKGAAARALRRAGVGNQFTGAQSKRRRPPEHYVTVVAEHARNIDSDRALDSTRSVAASGDLLRGGSPNVGGQSGTLTLMNETDEPIVTTAGPAICMYDDAAHKSNFANLNGVILPPHGSKVVDIQANKFSRSGVRGSGLGIGQHPSQAAAMFNAEARQLGFEMYARYDPDTHFPPFYPNFLLPGFYEAQPPRFGSIMASSFPGPNNANSEDCDVVTSTFVVGADTQDGLHAMGIAAYGKDGTKSTATLDSFGLQARLTDSGTKPWITFTKGQSPYQPSSDCTGAGAVWMSCLYPPGSARAQTELTSMAIPGSHDSGTAQLNVRIDSLAVGVCDGVVQAEGFGPSVVYNLAAAQRLNLREQLDLGIRYLDIRAGYDIRSGVWRVHHSQFSQSTLDQDLATVAQWAAAHPGREPIILDVTVCNAGLSHLDSFANAFSAKPKLTADAAAADGFTPANIASVAMKPPAGIAPRSFSRLSMQEIYDAPKGGNVLVLLNDPAQVPKGTVYPPAFLKGTPAFLRGDPSTGGGSSGPPPYPDPSRVAINSYWPQEQAPFACHAWPDANNAVAAYPDSPDRNPRFSTYRSLQPVTQTPFMIGQLLYTIASNEQAIKDWLKTLASNGDKGCPQSLLDWERGLTSGNEYRAGMKIVENWGDAANIVITDDVGNVRSDAASGSKNYVDFMVGINQQRIAKGVNNLSPISPISPSTPQTLNPPPPQPTNRP